MNNYSEDVYGVLHLKTQARNANEGAITVDNLYIGHGEIFHGETNTIIGLYGSVTIQGDARIRNVAEDPGKNDKRILNIYSAIHGDGILQFESEKAHDGHTADIYLMRSNNDFSGKVFVESGSNVHIDDQYEMHYSYDYQTHLYITGENALYNAAHVLNEGFIYALADQRFKNYDGDDSYGQFTGVGELIVTPGVNVELLYDNPELGYEPIGLITVQNENNNPGTLNFNIPEGMTKTIFMTEDPAEYSKIEGQGNIVKTGDGTLKILAAAEGLVGAESFVISSGRLDMEGYFEGTLKVVNDTIEVEEATTFSPGISVGAIDIEGDLILYDGAVLLMEIGGTTFTANDQLILNGKVTFEEGSIVQFALADDSKYTPEDGQLIAVNMPKVDWKTATFASDDFTLADYDDLAGLQYITPITNPAPKHAPRTKGETTGAAPVPEPSTWALLILGVAGLYFIRKRKA